MREQTVCFTGHREIPFGQSRRIAGRLETVLTELIGQGYRYFGAGDARGFDMLAEQTVLRLKKRHPQIRLILVLPCPFQTRGWSPSDRRQYDEIYSRCDKCVYTASEYHPGCMLTRNRHLVDCSSVCIAYLTQSTGGTAYTVQYARKKGLRIINLAGKAENPESD